MPSVKDQIQARNNVTITGGGSQTIVWAHGFGCDQSIWVRQIDTFKNSHRCVLFDQIGSTDRNAALFSNAKYRDLTGFVDDLEDVCLYFAEPGAVLVAHSVGAMIGLLASIRRPALFSKIVMIGACPRYLTDADFPGVYGQEDLNVIYRRMEESYEEWAAVFSAAIMKHTNRPELSATFMRSLKQLRPEIALATLCLILQSDYRDQLDRVETPAVIIQGLRDPVVPALMGQYMHTRIKNSKLIQIDVEGHLPHVAEPDLINHLLWQQFQNGNARDTEAPPAPSFQNV
jgi:sigma-B regulation protein RsbQ